MSLLRGIMGSFIAATSVAAETIKIDLSDLSPARGEPIPMGTSRAPDGQTITVDGVSLLRCGQPWLPVMGEFHYSRYPHDEWRDELLKMQAGGIDIVATYVFWIHHEEAEGEWDWTGQRNLRKFVQTCHDVGLPIVVRIGPWCHGEVRNGGLPDWILPLKKRLRTEDPEFLGKTRILYQQIANQLTGLLWKDGGPVIGLQLDNEYYGPASYLLALKKIAIECGIDVPMYTRTGWPNLTTPMPPGEILPLFGAYAEGFWDRTLEPMPGKYWRAFIFAPERTDAEVGTDQLGQRDATDAAGTQQYPYLTCELGGGMMSSYHRRILIQPRDVDSIALTKVGSGSNLPGYYMYHGGTNPVGRRTTLHESQATRYPNDLPVMSYDFQAPLGEFGQVRQSYHRLRRLHLLLRDFGPRLARMPVRFPEKLPQNGKDTETLRHAVRSDGDDGFLFVNNYQRLLPMPARPDVQFELKLAGGTLTLPERPVTIPADVSFVWPFNLDLGGAKLVYATAQPVCYVDADEARYVVFAQTPAVSADFVFDSATVTGQARFMDVAAGEDVAIDLASRSGQRIRIILLDDSSSLNCWKAMVGNRQRIVLSRSNLVFEGKRIRARGDAAGGIAVAMLPAPGNSQRTPGSAFGRYSVELDAGGPSQPALEAIRPAGAVREIPVPPGGVAQAPDDADFDNAAVWRIRFPAAAAIERDQCLRIHYIGDVARLYLDGKLIADHFYNGTPLELGLRRFAPAIYRGDLLLKVLPLRKDAPIYLAQSARPSFGEGSSAIELQRVEVIETHEVAFDVND